MPKYMILHNAPEGARDFMAKFTPEEMKAGMAEWIAWRDEANKTIKFEFGMPMQPVARITPTGVVATDNQASGYSMVDAASKEQVLEALKNHPHLKREGATLDVLEIVPMQGTEA